MLSGFIRKNQISSVHLACAQCISTQKCILNTLYWNREAHFHFIMELLCSMTFFLILSFMLILNVKRLQFSKFLSFLFYNIFYIYGLHYYSYSRLYNGPAVSVHISQFCHSLVEQLKQGLPILYFHTTGTVNGITDKEQEDDSVVYHRGLFLGHQYY